MEYNVGMVSLGCSKNQVDAERMLSFLRQDGFNITADPADCDVIIVNTCGFIEDAKRESIESIFEMARYKNNRLKVLAVTGCLAQRYKEEIAFEIPEADVILGIGSIKDVAKSIKEALSGNRVVAFEDRLLLPLDGDRVLSGPPYSAYLKVADGCDNRCSYCAIPEIRGPFRSRKIEEVVKEAEELANRGVAELSVVAQDTTRYGEDIYGRQMLPELLRRLCEIKKLHWIRLLYCYPDRIDDELIDAIASLPKVAKYIDMPLQHIDDTVLLSMNRRGDAKYIEALIQKIRRRIPGVVIRTTFIAGLPGEGEAEFERLCNFVKAQAFERLGCFAYSAEDSTPAASFPNQVDEQLRKRRADIIMEIQMQIAGEHSASLKGRTLEVLCEGYDRSIKKYVGRSYMDAPDIDTRVYFSSAKKLSPGEFVNVLVTGADGYDIIGSHTKEGGI